uniref:Uncharacterized protein n=1 Tax=Athene cunicularia TaxID=194338 RepID=A0A663LNM9_ATHCN
TTALCSGGQSLGEGGPHGSCGDISAGVPLACLLSSTCGDFGPWSSREPEKLLFSAVTPKKHPENSQAQIIIQSKPSKHTWAEINGPVHTGLGRKWFCLHLP